MSSNPITEWLARATAWDWLTNVTAFIAVGMLALLILGFRRYVKRPRTAPIDYIGTGIWVLALIQLLRIFWWDLLPDILNVSWRENYGFRAAHINWFFNVLIIVGVWYKLHGYWKLVEEKVPGQYNTFTAVFYPKRLKLWIEAKANRGNEDE